VSVSKKLGQKITIITEKYSPKWLKI